MKIKNVGELKKYLEQFPDNLEIKYFNGMVDDWHNVNVVEHELVKEKPSFTLKLINHQNERNGDPIWDKLKPSQYKVREWELRDSLDEELFRDDPSMKKEFSFKKILLFEGITRGLSSFDRMGSIHY